MLPIVGGTAARSLFVMTLEGFWMAFRRSCSFAGHIGQRLRGQWCGRAAKRDEDCQCDDA